MARGSLRKQSTPGRWWGRIDVKTQDGRRKQLTKTIKAKNPQEAEKLFNAWVVDVQQKYQVYQDALTVNDLIELWLKNYCDAAVKQGKMTKSTRNWYDYTSRRIVQNLGALKIDKVDFNEIENFYNNIVEEDVGPKYAYEHFSLLKTVFNYAVEKGFLMKNELPRYVRSLGLSKKPVGNRPRVFEDSEIDKILEETKDNRILHLIINIACETGMRRGEILGLQWKHIDFDNKAITVEQQLQKIGRNFEVNKPKTQNGFRTIPMTSYVLGVLREYYEEKKNQIAVLEDELYDHDYIMTNEVLELIDPNLVTRWLRLVLEKLDTEEQKRKNPPRWSGRGLHCLRHTFASNMIRAGVNAAELSVLLGHYSVDFTYKTYVHLFQDSKKEAIQKFEAYKRKQRLNSERIADDSVL